MRLCRFLALGALTFLGATAQAETLGNSSVIEMVQAGLGERLIIDKISSESCNYEVSVDKIIILKKAGVSDEIISAMVRRCSTLSQQRGLAGNDTSADPTVMHSPGIYADQTNSTPPKLQLIRPTKASGMRASGNGSILFPFKTKLVIPGSSSNLVFSAKNQGFYFYFNISDEKVSDFGMEKSLAAQSPDEFSLVKFTVKNQIREIMIGKVQMAFGASIQKGVDPKYTIRFQNSEISNGIYKVAFDTPLPTGEYAFIFTGSDGNSRIYDFSVSPE